MFNRVLVVLAFLLMPVAVAQNIQVNIYANGNEGYSSSNNYVYRQNPPRQSLMTSGRYIMLNSKVRYIHSPSKLKGAKQAARIDYYNSLYD